MSRITVLKMLLKVDSPDYGILFKRMNVKQDLEQLVKFIQAEFPEAVSHQPNQVRIRDEFYLVSLNSKGILLRLIEEPLASKPYRNHDGRGEFLVASYGIPEETPLIPYDSGHLINLPPRAASEMRWTKRSVQLDVLTKLLPPHFPDYSFGKMTSQRITFSSCGIDYRCAFLAEGIYILRQRSNATLSDHAIGRFDVMEDAIRASLERLGQNAGFLGTYMTLPDAPKRNCYYAAFEVDGLYYRGVVNGRTRVYGLERSVKLNKLALVNPGPCYVSLNYGPSLNLSEEEMNHIFKRNRKAGRIIPLEEI